MLGVQNVHLEMCLICLMPLEGVHFGYSLKVIATFLEYFPGTAFETLEGANLTLFAHFPGVRWGPLTNVDFTSSERVPTRRPQDPFLHFSILYKTCEDSVPQHVYSQMHGSDPEIGSLANAAVDRERSTQMIRTCHEISQKLKSSSLRQTAVTY